MEEQQPSSFSNTYSVPSYSSSQKSSKRFIVLLIIVLIAGIGFGAYKFLGTNSSKQPIPLTPTPTAEVFPSDTPTPIESPTPSEPLTPTAKPTANPVDKASGLDRSDLSVSILNGSGEVGAASKASDVLKSFGYHVVSTGNADNFDYENVVIQVKSTKSTYLALLKKDLFATYTVGASTSDLSASSSADAVVIVGK